MENYYKTLTAVLQWMLMVMQKNEQKERKAIILPPGKEANFWQGSAG